MKKLMLLAIDGIIHEVLFKNEIDDFIEKTPEWELNTFKWHDVESELELSDFTFYNKDLCSKVRKNFPDFKTNITVQTYWNYILKLETGIKTKKMKKKTKEILNKCKEIENIHLFYNDVQKINEYAHKINTLQIFDFDNDVNDTVIKLMLLPLVEQGFKI
jgi:hypothetical protein